MSDLPSEDVNRLTGTLVILEILRGRYTRRRLTIARKNLHALMRDKNCLDMDTSMS